MPPWREEQAPGREAASITVGDAALLVELSVEPQQQSPGRGYRNDLSERRGMSVMNDTARPRPFRMNGIRFCIGIPWIEGDEIVGTAGSVCPDTEGTQDADRARFHAGQPITCVPEIPAG